MTRKNKVLVVLGVLIVGVLAMLELTTPVQAFLNCKGVSCAAPACEDNEHLQVPPGACCPICVPN